MRISPSSLGSTCFAEARADAAAAADSARVLGDAAEAAVGPGSAPLDTAALAEAVLPVATEGEAEATPVVETEGDVLTEPVVDVGGESVDELADASGLASSGRPFELPDRTAGGNAGPASARLPKAGESALVLEKVIGESLIHLGKLIG